MGSFVGHRVGMLEGSNVGFSDGLEVRCADVDVGFKVGWELGLCDGWKVGPVVVSQHKKRNVKRKK